MLNKNGKGSSERGSEKQIFHYAGMEPNFEASKQQLAVDIAWSRKQTPVECLSILNTLLLQTTRMYRKVSLKRQFYPAAFLRE